MAKSYLVAYNTVSAFLWGAVLSRLIVLYPLVGPKFVGDGLADFTRWVQTLAILEVVHSAFGLVKSPVTTTLMQIASRLLLTWGVMYPFPDSTLHRGALSTMVLAWSITEVIRYTYYAFNLEAQSRVPQWLIWLRYTTFYVLYPLGAGSEALLIFFSLDEAHQASPAYALLLKVIMVIYIPSFYVLYTHMLKQRKRVFKNVGKRRVD